MVKEESHGLFNSRGDAEKAILSLTTVLTRVMQEGSKVNITGFAEFSGKFVKGKTGTLPGSTKTYTTKDKMVPKITATPKLKEIMKSNS